MTKTSKSSRTSPYEPSQEVMDKYADVLVNFALNRGKGIKRGDVVVLNAPEAAKPLFVAARNAILRAGGHVISQYIPSDEDRYHYSRDFFTLSKIHQIEFVPKKYLKGLVDDMDHLLFILADTEPHALSGTPPKKIMKRGEAMKPYKEWRRQKENKGKLSWTIALYTTGAMAHEAGLSEKAYWNQIIRACFLDEEKPKQVWKRVYREMSLYEKKLNALSPKVDRLHVEGADADLWITLGENRRWLSGRGANIPSFEIFTSPDWRGTEGWIRFNQPLYRYGTRIEGVELEFKNGRVVKSRAANNQQVLRSMIATPGADKVGEFSLTDKRHSRITKFMAETLYDENVGGPQGNTHIALGSSYEDTFNGDVSKLTKAKSKALGFNDSSVHTDIVSTTKRRVTAHLRDGREQVIYENGSFVL